MKITNKEQIRKALGFPDSTKETDIPNELESVGVSTFNGDSMPDNWSANNYFETGEEYDVYEFDCQLFAIGNDGRGRKVNFGRAWSKIKNNN